MHFKNDVDMSFKSDLENMIFMSHFDTIVSQQDIAINAIQITI